MQNNLYIRKNRHKYVIPFEEILYLSKELRIINVVTSKGTISYYGKFADLKTTLDMRFMVFHRSYIINMDEIREMTEGRIVMSNGDVILIGKNSFYRGLRAFNNYRDNFV